MGPAFTVMRNAGASQHPGTTARTSASVMRCDVPMLQRQERSTGVLAHCSIEYHRQVRLPNARAIHYWPSTGAGRMPLQSRQGPRSGQMI